MIPTLDHLKNPVGLRDYLEKELWFADFGYTTRHRAEDYVGSGRILEIQVEPPNRTGVEIFSKVQGNERRPYRVSIALRPRGKKWLAVSTCTCPVNYQCKHAAAVLTELQAALLQDITRPGGNLDLMRKWLESLKSAAEPAEDPTPKFQKSSKYLAYSLEENPVISDGLKLYPRPGRTLRDGSPRIDDMMAAPDLGNPPAYLQEEDIPVLAAYAKCKARDRYAIGIRVSEKGMARVLDLALATGRLFYRDSDHTATRLTAGDPMTASAGWEPLDDGGLKPVIKLADEKARLIDSDPPMYLDIAQGKIGPLESVLPASLLATWQEGPQIAPEFVPEIHDALADIDPGEMLPVPEVVETDVVTVAPTPCLHIRHFSVRTGPWKDAARELIIAAEFTFRYGDSRNLKPLENDASLRHIESGEGKRVVYNRDLRAETDRQIELIQFDFLPLHLALNPNSLDPENRDALVPAGFLDDENEAELWHDIILGGTVTELRENGWDITIAPGLGIHAIAIDHFHPILKAGEKDGIDWFHFDFTFEANGKTHSLIPYIAQYLRRHPKPAEPEDTGVDELLVFKAPEPDGGFLHFPKIRFLQIVESVRHLYEKKAGADGLLLHKLEAAEISNTLDLAATDATIRSLRELGGRLKNIRSLPEIPLPDGLHATLRPYQIDGYRWLQFLARNDLHGILADDMGLGKTLQTLAHLLAESQRKPGLPSLVVAPTSVVGNWASEARKFAPDLKVLVLHGPARRASFPDIPRADLVITSYALFGRDAEQHHSHEWHCLVLDEAQYIKNPKAIATRALGKVKARHRLCLSGTPMENHLGELWSLMHFLMPGFLGSSETFRKIFRTPIEKHRDGRAQAALNTRVGPLLLRRTKDQVATDLPAKSEILHTIPLTAKQTDLYESVRIAMDGRIRAAIADKGLASSQIVVLDALLKLRQICCHPFLLGTPAAQKAGPSAKLDFLTADLLPTLLEEGRRILLFSQFTSMLALIEDHLTAHKIPYLKLTGSTPSTDRSKLVKAFQAGEAPLFLISLKAGGTGLNLTAADTVIHYDPWWNPAAENQATDRAHRIGQQKPVFVHKLISQGSIEERIQELQQRKSTLVQALLSEDVARLKIDADTLSALLAPL